VQVFNYEDPSALEKSPSFARDFKAFEAWLQKGYQGKMSFLEKNKDVRQNVNLILPSTVSALSFLIPYAKGLRVRKKINPLEPSYEGGVLKLFARYARGKDYHKVMKEKLNALGEDLKGHFSFNVEHRALVDSVPFFDRAHAREAGLGFIGKNTLLIRPGLGSFFFIGTLLTNVPASLLAEPSSHNPIATLDCGTCRKCLEACPTNAFEEPYVLNANKCLAYHSIENRQDVIPIDYIPHFKDTLFGCDICQEVCPYNLVTNDFVGIKDLLTPKPSLLTYQVKDLALMTRKQYELWFGGSAITRVKYEGLVRNAFYHLYATNDENLYFCLEARENMQDEEGLIQKTCEQIKALTISQGWQPKVKNS
jgi:epoxyqueuosine reductase